ncbi:Uncharacterised protein [uncultured archaeon]|nr:Uncharacterised protein [uncultured archaeon]
MKAKQVVEGKRGKEAEGINAEIESLENKGSWAGAAGLVSISALLAIGTVLTPGNVVLSALACGAAVAAALGLTSANHFFSRSQEMKAALARAENESRRDQKVVREEKDALGEEIKSDWETSQRSLGVGLAGMTVAGIAAWVGIPLGLPLLIGGIAVVYAYNTFESARTKRKLARYEELENELGEG